MHRVFCALQLRQALRDGKGALDFETADMNPGPDAVGVVDAGEDVSDIRDRAAKHPGG